MNRAAIPVLALVALAGCVAPAAGPDATPAPRSFEQCTTGWTETMVWGDRLEPYLPAGFYVVAWSGAQFATDAIHEGALVLLDVVCDRASFTVTAIRVSQTVRPDIVAEAQYFVIESQGLEFTTDTPGALAAGKDTLPQTIFGPGAHRHEVTYIVGSPTSQAELDIVLWDEQAPWAFVGQGRQQTGSADCAFGIDAAFFVATGRAWTSCGEATRAWLSEVPALRATPL